MKEKIKIMETPPQVTDEEIRSYMDFEALLKEKDRFSSQWRNDRNIKYTFIGALTLIALSSMIFFLRSQEDHVTPPKTDVTRSPQSLPMTPDTTDDKSVTSSETRRTPDKKTPREQKVIKPQTLKQDQATAKDSATVKKQPVYNQAEPVAGYPALYEYFNTHLVYPEGAVKDSIEGIVNVVFVIDTKGKAKNISVENSLGELFDKEAIRLIEQMPSWRPATYNGKPVESRISLPLTFEIQKISNQ